MAKNDGGAAFPSAVAVAPQGDVYGSGYFDYGMSLRDWFAGNFAATTMQLNDHNCNEYQAGRVAQFAYMVADAMIKARDA